MKHFIIENATPALSWTISSAALVLVVPIWERQIFLGILSAILGVGMLCTNVYFERKLAYLTGVREGRISFLRDVARELGAQRR